MSNLIHEVQAPRIHAYRALGLEWRSEIELPELVPANETDACTSMGQVCIRFGQVPKSLGADARHALAIQVVGTRCRVWVQEVGRFLVENGEHVFIEPAEDASERDIRGILLSIVLAVVLHQQRKFPLHASAIITPRGTIAFTGDSGAGKSTIAAWCQRETGWPVLCDDISVLQPLAEEPVLFGGFIRLRLWSDALQLLGIDQTGLERDLSRAEKFQIIDANLFAPARGTLTNLIVLKEADEVRLTELQGVEKFHVIRDATVRPGYAAEFNDMPLLFRAWTKLSEQIRVHELSRPRSEEGLKASVDLVLTHVG